MDNTTVKELDLDFNNEKLVEDIKQQCYSNKAYIQLYQQQGFSLINMALLMNELEFADWLVDNGAEVNTTNDGGTPLSCACFKGNAKLIKKIAAKTSKEYLNKSGAVGQAIYSAKKGNVQAALDLGFSINEPDNYGSTPLYTAISAIEALESEFREPGVTLKKELKLVEFLLNKGAVLGPKELQSLKYWDELRGKNEENILFYCFNYQMYDLLKLLIENGIDVNAKNKDNINFLDLMVKMKIKKYIQFIIDKSEIKESSQADALIISSKDKEIATLLLEGGFNPSAKLENGESVLHRSTDLSIEKAFNYPALLIEYGADVNAKDDKGLTPIVNTLLSDYFPHVKPLAAFKIIMGNKPNLIDINIVNQIFTLGQNNGNFQDIFDVAIWKNRFDWFEPFYTQMSKAEQALYDSKRLKNLFENDNTK